MREINLEDLKRIELNILCRVRDICDRENIRYTIDGGTLLGAVRHGGFIPWDDDIDISMPRPDYDRFVSYCMSNEVPFGLTCKETDGRFCDLYAKAYDVETVGREEYVNRYGAEYGVHIDIFPIDGLADTQEEALKLFRKSKGKRRMLTAANWRVYRRNRMRKWYYDIGRWVYFLISRGVNAKKLVRKIEMFYRDRDFDRCQKVAVVCGRYGDREVMDASIFREYADISFEGEVFRCIAKYDEFLTNLYGNYMELPPKEKRVAHHTFTAYYKDATEKEKI